MDNLKKKIKDIFCAKIDGLGQTVTPSNIELVLNNIIEECIEEVDFSHTVSIPVTKTSNNNCYGNDFEIASLKPSDVELPSDNRYFQASQNNVVPKEETTIPDNFSLNDEMRNYAAKNFIPKEHIDVTFEDFKLYYQSKGVLNSNWDAVWKRWVLNNNKYKNHLIKTTIDENMVLSESMRKFALEHIDKNNIDMEFLKFKNHYIASGDIKVSWEKVWQNWCIQYKQFKPRHQSAQAVEKSNYRWDFKKAKETSDRIKDWLEFEKGINWLDDFYWKGISIPGIGWQRVQHPDFNKEEILLYKIESDNGQFMLDHKSEDIIDTEVLEND